MLFIFSHKLFKHFKHSEYKERTIGLYEETPSSKERKNDILPKESQKEPNSKKCIKKELLFGITNIYDQVAQIKKACNT